MNVIDQVVMVIHGAPLGAREDERRPAVAPGNIEDQRPYGDFTPGRYAWLLEDVRPITPVPAKGRQGLWTPAADLVAEVTR